MIYLERTLEEHKIALANQLDFHLGETFALFTDNQLGRLSQFDLGNGLSKMGVTVNESDITLLRERYDAD